VKTYVTLSEIQSDLSNGEVSCTELVKAYLARIEAYKHLNAFVEVFEDEAIQQAEQVDSKLQQGTAGRLAGLVIGIKDLLCYKAHNLTASSHILEGFQSIFTGTAIQRLIDEDAVIIGRQNCDEFAMGSSNENSSLGIVKNPFDIDYVPGGSSGGSAAAVAANLCHASIGSDTGGSVRQPASFCGIVGLKPTYGRISRWGLIAYASSFDQIGPLTRSVEDAALLLSVMAGPDGKDHTLSQRPSEDFTLALNQSSPKATIGYIQEVLDNPSLDNEIKDQTYALLEQLKQAGHEIVELHFPYLDYVVPCYYILTPAEASSNLQRYDGIRYGYRTHQADSIAELYTHTRSEGFGTEVKRRIMLGTFVLSAGYYDAYYTQAMKVRRLIRDTTLHMFQSCDFMLMPTTPTPAFKIGEKSTDPIEMYLSDIFTVHANLAGIPAISLPLGQHSSGLPFGVQLMAPPFQESPLLNFSQYLMRKTAITLPVS